MKNGSISIEEAIVLQQLYEDGEDDIRSLARESGLPRQFTIVTALKLEQKGLITLYDTFDGLLLRVSQRGKQLVKQVWPEARAFAL